MIDLRAEVEALIGSRPPTIDELDDARRALIEGQARSFETPSALVSRYAGLFLYDLPPDDHAYLAERLSGVTVGAMVESARRHVRPEAFVAVIVADATWSKNRCKPWAGDRSNAWSSSRNALHAPCQWVGIDAMMIE